MRMQHHPRNRFVPHRIPPENDVQLTGIGAVLMAEVHLRGLLCARSLWSIGGIDQPIVTVRVVSLKRRLVPCAAKERSNQRRKSVVVVHRRNAEQILHRPQEADRRVERRIHRRLRRLGRVFAHHQRNAAMRIHMVRPVLSIILKDEERRIVPVRTVRDRLNGAANRQVVVGD